mmetsp:Transcript_2227/g.3659  ORF Transcript_2227/g.3659 Transcript_2227/m.3659 type:complete len:326 (-) Transcript_2227:63-1040(-)|eukprot:CAMPEP_0178762212 /NCGR_PEP_ID=MMETSP0744-20121128/16415_1 /TAXON_ID=913974 /ORGANISM="Nitzschia punctata, Strain CCMP561" /LENGTH=325 /DNA_ID=CAMNT_0020416861 /DNA_START=208 /DNA_END=1185 /DNA_ORIENTATION=-
MANLTDPLIRSIQGTDPQNLMEYITRQKIYDSRFWKEECFGLTAADVLERAAKSLSCIGGSYGGTRRPTKFLCLTLKLLQLQPDMELIQTFLEQDHFKYLRALGAFYLRLTGRAQDIYEMLEPLYADFSKLKYRDVNEWKLIHMDEFIDELLTKSFACGIAMPRLPMRETLQDAGYLDEGPRPTGLQRALEQAGGPKEYLKLKVDADTPGAVALWEQRFGKKKRTTSQEPLEKPMVELKSSSPEEDPERGQRLKRKSDSTSKVKEDRTKKRKKNFGGTLFKTSKSKSANSKEVDQESSKLQAQPEEGSEEYWNDQRAKLGLKPLK